MTDAVRAALAELVSLRDLKDRLQKLHEMGHGTDYESYHRRRPLAWEAARAALTQPTAAQQAEAVRAKDGEAVLSLCEQRAVLADPMGLQCLINYHDCQEAGADAMEPGAGQGNGRRALQLLALGREIIARDPELWPEEEKRAFALRHSERAALKSAQTTAQLGYAGPWCCEQGQAVGKPVCDECAAESAGYSAAMSPKAEPDDSPLETGEGDAR